MMRMGRALTVLCLLLSLATATPVPAAEIKILSGSAIETAMAELIPKFEQASRHKVSSDFDGTIGGMTQRIRNGEAADVLIASAAQIAILEKEGKIAAGSRADIAKVGVGVFVRNGAPKPDIRSVDAFKRAMLAAKSIGCNDPAAGAPVSRGDEAEDRDIHAALGALCRRCPGRRRDRLQSDQRNHRRTGGRARGTAAGSDSELYRVCRRTRCKQQGARGGKSVTSIHIVPDSAGHLDSKRVRAALANTTTA
jgi:hypothetical protein